MHIVIISGSARQGRQTPKAVIALRRELESRPEVTRISIIDVLDYNFPIMVERRGRNAEQPPRLDECGDLIDSADGIVIASPEYNGSFPGVLKNTMDYFYQEYRKKPFGVMMVSGGGRGGIRAAQDVQKYILALQGFPMPYMLLIANVRDVLNDDGDILDERLARSFVKFGDEFIWLTQAIMRQKAVE